MSKRTYHVEYNQSDKEWKVRLTGSTRASKTADTKRKAVREAKRLANQRGAELHVYTREGRHQETQNYASVDRAKQR